MVIEPPALHLRLRDDAAPDAPPDIEAFARAPGPADPRDAADLGVLPGPAPLDPDGPLVLFLQHPEFGIPAPGYDHRVPDLDAWSVRPTKIGWIASVPPPPREPGPRRAVQVLAGCLALALSTSNEALAQSPAIPAPQAPAAQTARPAPPPPAQPPATPAADPSTEPAPPPAAIPPPVVSRDVVASITDAAWEGVDGIDAIVELKGGKVLRGRIGAVQQSTFTLIDGATGQILVVPKSGVASLRAFVPPPLPTRTGTGLLVGGGILTGLGIPVFITGLTFVGICPSCGFLHLPMLIVGAGALGGGIPMLARGTQRRSAFQKALLEQRVTPVVSRTPYGWNGGLQIRF